MNFHESLICCSIFIHEPFFEHIHNCLFTNIHELLITVHDHVTGTDLRFGMEVIRNHQAIMETAKFIL